VQESRIELQARIYLTLENPHPIPCSRNITFACLLQELLNSVWEMDHFAFDIIVPVWNNPTETRNCLASLVEHSPGARFILMDNGSNRETESLLQNFAELLNERALLLRKEVTSQFIKVVNRGLARAEAPLSVIVKTTTIVTDGWLQPLLESVACRPDIGVATPALVEKKDILPTRKKITVKPPIEISHGSFAAIMVTKNLYDRIGGFDEGLDGRSWCLKDYSRRAWREGFVTVNVAGAPAYFQEDVLLGSLAKREELIRKSVALFTERWGEERAYYLEMKGEASPDNLDQKFAFLLNGARLGHHFTVLAHPEAYRAIVAAGYNLVHKNIDVEQLPTFFAAHAVRKRISRLRENIADIRALAETDCMTAIDKDEDSLPEAEIID